ncbi:DUF5684 domain-containing protein [Microbacterium sp. BWT-B31]|uniref:DUF5684 domain-containing protein n=1 Tax=Microbacterium sp. BWT-B31 TaxID=3232072 RepID=UPI003527F86A
MNNDATASILGPLLGLFLWAGVYVWASAALAAVFRKCGVEPWKAWVPILNSVVLVQLVGYSPWLLLLGLLPVINVIAMIVLFSMVLYRLNVVFGYGAGMTVVGVVAFPIWASVVGWGSARWIGRAPDASARASFAVDRASTEAAAGLPPLPRFPAPASPPGYPAGGRTGALPPAAAGFVPAAAAGFAPPASSLPPMPHHGAGASAPGAVPPAPAGVYGGTLPVMPPRPPAPPAAPAPAVPVAAAPAGVPAPAVASDDTVDVETSTAAWTPPVAPGRPVSAAPAAPAFDERDPWQGFVLDTTDKTGEVTGAVAGAPAPISAVPSAPAAGPTRPEAPGGASATRGEGGGTVAPPTAAVGARRRSEADEADEAPRLEDITRPPVTRVPLPVPAADDRDPWAPASEADAFPESSGPVSAVADAPYAGAPRSARLSVSAFHTKPEIPDDEDVLEETIIARRKRTDWTLVPPIGDPVALTAEVVFLGRRPNGDPAFPGAQLVAILDGTVSKTHARLRLRDGRWWVTDLHSTNGVLFTTETGAEVEVPPGEEVEVAERFLLGDAEVQLQRSQE